MTSSASRDDLIAGLQRTKSDPPRIRLNEWNLHLILSRDEAWDGVLYYNKLDGLTYFQNRPIQDSDFTRIQMWVSEAYGLDYPMAKVIGVTYLVACQREVNPVKDYLISLRSGPLIDIRTVLTRYFGCPDTELTRAYSRAWLMSAAWRGIRPGVKADGVLVLYGKQGSGKSTGLRALAGPEWFSDAPFHIGDPQKEGMALAGTWIYELGEISSLRKAEADDAKAMASRQIDRFRRPYAREMTHSPRTCVLAGTTNNRAIHSDPTGSRRWWVVETGDIDVKGLERDRDMIWTSVMAQIRVAADSNNLDWLCDAPDRKFEAWAGGLPPMLQWWLSPEEEELRGMDTAEWTADDPWEDELDFFLADKDFVTNRQLFSLLKIPPTSGRRVSTRLTPLMDARGWKRYRTPTQRGWRKPPG